MFWTAAATWWWIRPPPFSVSYKKKHILCLPPTPPETCVYTHATPRLDVLCVLWCYFAELNCWLFELLLPFYDLQPVDPFWPLTWSTETVEPAWKSPVDQQFVQFKPTWLFPTVLALNFSQSSSLRQQVLMCWAEAMRLVGYLFSLTRNCTSYQLMWLADVCVCVCGLQEGITLYTQHIGPLGTWCQK